MDKVEYSEFINHPLWKKKREEVFRFYGKKCSKCDSRKFPHVHHKTYARGKMPWEYPIENFIVLCERCHNASHGYEYTRNQCNVCGKEIPEKFKLCIDCYNKTVGKMERDRKIEAQKIESQLSSLRKVVVSIVVVIVALTAFFVLKSVLSEKNDYISLNEVKSHIGKNVIVQGVVSQINYAKKGNLYLNMGGEFPRHKLGLVIFKDKTSKFRNLTQLKNKIVKVKGKLSTYKGKPQIIINKKSQIEVQ